MNELKFAIRQLSKHKVASASVILILALAIGGVTAVYSVADRALLNPVPYQDSDRLISFMEADIAHGTHWNTSPDLINELSNLTDQIEELTYFSQFPERLKLKRADEVQRLQGAKVASNFFDWLQIVPSMGRSFRAEDVAPDSEKTIVISHGLWQSHFGGDRQIVGTRIDFEAESRTVIGVMPPHVDFPFGNESSQFWIPTAFTQRELDSSFASQNRVWTALARLQPGADLASLKTRLAGIESRRAPFVNQDNQRWTIAATPWRLGGDTLHTTFRSLLVMLIALLLIACGNVANLLLSRTLARQGEISLRYAIGAGKLRIARQLLSESAVLTCLATVVGILIAWAGLNLLRQFYLSGLPRLQAIHMDWNVIAVTCLVAFCATLLFSSVSIWFALRTDLNHSLKESTHRHSAGALQQLLQNSLVVGQVCLAVALLAGAGLTALSVVKLLRVDPGLQPQGLYRVFYDATDFMNTPAYDVEAAIASGMSPEQARQERAEARVERHIAFQRLALERLQSIPGVAAAAIRDSAGQSDYDVDGVPNPIFLGSCKISALQGDFLKTIGAKLTNGRLLTAADATPGETGVVINEEMAQLCWPGQNPLGRTFQSQDGERQGRVIGVIQNVRDFQRQSKATPVFYLPVERLTDSAGSVGDYVVRTSLDYESLRAAVVQAGRNMLAPVRLLVFEEVSERLHRSTAPQRVMMWLFVTLGSLGLALSALGIYAVLAYSVQLRGHEISIRMALGAAPRQIRELFLFRGLRLVTGGLILGAVLSVYSSRFIESLLFEFSTVNFWTLALVVLSLAIVGGIASWFPARQAASIHPTESLR